MRKHWYMWDVLIVAAVVLGSPYFLPVLGYFDGLQNGLSLAGMYVVCLLWPLLGIGLIVLAVRMIHTWPRHIGGKRRLWLLRLAVIAGFTTFFVLPFTSVQLVGPPGFAEGFRRYARSQVDVPAIQTWLGTLDPNLCTGEDVEVRGVDRLKSRWPNSVTWPEAITRLGLHYVQRMKMETGRPKIRLTWGGALGHWGVEIGPADMPIPKTLPRRKNEQYGRVFWDEGEDRLPLAPGAYVWQEVQ